MTIACPHCAAPTAFSAEPVARDGRMMRCARCGTSWLARLNAEDPYGSERLSPALRHGRPRFERIVEHVDANFTANAASGRTFGKAKPSRWDRVEVPPARDWRLFRKGRLAAWSSVGAAVVLVGLVAVTLFHSSGVDAATDGKFAGLEVRMLGKGLEAVRDGRAVALSGEITNRSDEVLDVPAVHVALLTKGVELYSWTVEPTTARIAPGDRIEFRSAMAASPAGIDEVALRLADRHEMIVGMR